MKKLLLFVLLFSSFNAFAKGDKALGKKVYKKVNCALCHGPKGMGKAKNGKFALTRGPQIAGLDAKYIVEQMKAIKSKKRKTKYTTMMVTKIKKLKDKDIKDVAAYVTTLAPRLKGMLQEK